VGITVDNTPPEASITSPVEGPTSRGRWNFGARRLTRTSTATPSSIPRGHALPPTGGRSSGSGRTSVSDDVLAAWTNLPADGEYCLRLSVLDKLANSVEAKANIRIDTHPPSAPVLSGALANKTDASLTWTQNAEADLLGYNLYRGNQKLNPQPMTDLRYADRNLPDGVTPTRQRLSILQGWRAALPMRSPSRSTRPLPMQPSARQGWVESKRVGRHQGNGLQHR